MKLYKIDKNDTVAVAIEPISSGEVCEAGGESIEIKEDIRKGHKVALKDIAKGETVIKYGSPIGEAACDISRGSWIHTHNLISHADEDKEYSYDFHEEQVVMPGSVKSDMTFRGYHRPGGETGCRNYIAVMSGVFCANAHIKQIAEMANKMFPKTENFDGFLPLTHECGCGQEGEDLEAVRLAQAGLMMNPNFGGILFIQVGCEITRLENLREYGTLNEDRIRMFTMQEEDDEYDTAIRLAGELYDMVKEDRREDRPISELHIGLNCGGSDGFSGLTANKLVGELAEYLTARGATVSITEITEMFGAEQILMNKAIDWDTYEKVKHLLNTHKEYIRRYGGTANGNPSFGNKEGGLSTIEDKTLGCVQKGGNCAIADALMYGQRAVRHGFHLVQGPGSDLVGVTS
ncbi:MAG: UxaA family hydrolase, partial [Eubacteriaceae bacterium]|nr:UxaA family hydrolase [Eubacteriaceae bacterium]